MPDAMLRCCRHYFALFLWLETGAIAVSAAVAVARLRQGGHRFSEGNPAITWTAVFLVIDIFLLLSAGALSVTQVRLIGQLGSWAGGLPDCAPQLSMRSPNAAQCRCPRDADAAHIGQMGRQFPHLQSSLLHLRQWRPVCDLHSAWGWLPGLHLHTEGCIAILLMMFWGG